MSLPATTSQIRLAASFATPPPSPAPLPQHPPRRRSAPPARSASSPLRAASPTSTTSMSRSPRSTRKGWRPSREATGTSALSESIGVVCYWVESEVVAAARYEAAGGLAIHQNHCHINFLISLLQDHRQKLRINDEAIYRYRFNLHEELSSARFTKLATTYKNHATFSGTEVCLCLSNEADADDFVLWLVGFFHKILVLRAANLACELFVEQIGNAEPRNVCLPQDSDDIHHSVMVSSSDRLVSGLKDYALSHGYTCDKCDTCILNRDLLKIGTGAANSVDRRKAKGLHVEVVILIARTASDLSCWTVNCSSTQVLYFEDSVPCPISQSSFDVLVNVDWQSYGFKLKGGFIDDEGNAVLEWDDMAFARVDIAIHTYLECAMQECQGSQQDRHLVRKALKSALSHLKADHAGDFLSCHGQRVREYVPDLAESIAGLILSSNDKEFQDECISLLGLGSDQDVSEGLVQSSICEKMVHIIELNDTKENVEDNAPYLFECEKLDEDSQLDGEDADEDMVFDF